MIIRRIHLIVFLLILAILAIVTYVFKEEIQQTFFIVKNVLFYP
jgi:hypothetical protein